MTAGRAATRRFTARTRRLRVRLPRPGPRALAALVAGLALLGGVWLWVRQSPLVAVDRVTVSGASGPDAGRIRSALVSAARDMTTLDVQMSHLRTAVSPYPVVKSLHVSTDFPHGMRIRVVEQVPVAIVQVDGRSTPVSGDGTLLPNVSVDGSLPSIGLTVAPGGPRLTGIARTEARLLAAAPYALLAKVTLASSDATHGLVVQLRDGPRVYFGTGGQLHAKWEALTAVLAASSSAGAVYIDVTDPARPAAGAGSDASADGGAGGSADTSANSQTQTTPASADTGASGQTQTAPSSGATATTAGSTGGTDTTG